VATNVVNCAVVVIFIALIVVDTDVNTQILAANAGGAVMAVMSLLSAFIAFFYGFWAARGIRGTLSHHVSDSANRFLRTSLVLAICFVGEASLWLVTAIDINNFYANEESYSIAFYLFGVVALCVIIWLFGPGVNALKGNGSGSKQRLTRLQSKLTESRAFGFKGDSGDRGISMSATSRNREYSNGEMDAILATGADQDTRVESNAQRVEEDLQDTALPHPTQLTELPPLRPSVAQSLPSLTLSTSAPIHNTTEDPLVID